MLITYMNLTDDLIDAYKPYAKDEVKEIEAMAKKMKEDFKLEPWDFSYYSHKLQMEKYNLDARNAKTVFWNI